MAGGEGMGKRVAQDKVPPGWRFNPQDPELVNYYLKGKVCNKPIDADAIPEVDLYKFEPWDLSDKCPLKSNDGDMYFFSPRDKKYPNGLRTNRATLAGYWKATGKDRPVKGPVKGRSGVVGMKKTLVFYRGRAPHGERTDFVMHEYRLVEEQYEKIKCEKDFVICRVFKKNGVGPRSLEDRGLASYFDDEDDSTTEEQSGSPTSTLESNHTQNEPEEVTEVQQPVEGQQPPETSEPAQPGMSIEDYENSNFLVSEPLSLAALTNNNQVEVYHDSNESNPWNPEFVLQDPYEVSSGVQLDAPEAPAPDSWLEFFNGDISVHPPVPSGDGTCSASGGNLFRNMEHLAESLLDDEDSMPPLVEVHSQNEILNDQPSQQRMAYFGQTSEVAVVEETEPSMAWGSAPGSVAEQGLLYDPSLPAAESVNNTYVVEPSVGYAVGLESENTFEEAYDYFHDYLQDPFDESFNFPTFNESTGVSDMEITSGSYSRNQNVARSEVSSSSASTNFGASANIGAHGQSQNVSFDQNAGIDDGTMPSRPLVTSILKYLGAIPTLPASAAECPPEPMSSKALQKTSHLGDMAPSYNSIHVSAAVTVTCTRCADGKQQVQTAVADCYEDSEGVYQQVVSESWQSIPGEKGGKQGQTHTLVGTGTQRRVARGSNSGFVFVFVLGVMSAVIWALAAQGVYKLVRHIVTSLF